MNLAAENSLQQQSLQQQLVHVPVQANQAASLRNLSNNNSLLSSQSNDDGNQGQSASNIQPQFMTVE